MERHIAKRLGIPCAVISAPVHVQDFPARYSPQMGPEGASVLFDTWTHPLMMGLEEHLLAMFREDFEFNDTAPSHLGAKASAPVAASPIEPAPEPAGIEAPVATLLEEPVAEEAEAPAPAAAAAMSPGAAPWSADAEKELKKIPFFVRGKARRNTERYAAEKHLTEITLTTLYEAKAHYGR
jgi:light-independent protochlorophyllide reductase subunit B